MRAALRYLFKRLFWALFVVVGVTSISFVVAYMLPGDPARMLVGPHASAADLEQARKLYELDRPIAYQFVRYWKRMVHIAPPSTEKPAPPDHKHCSPIVSGLHLDLGYSFTYHKPVFELLRAKAPRSIELAFAALLFQALFGISLGAAAAFKRNSRLDEITIGISLVGISAPAFLLGLLLQYLLAYKLALLPYDGYGSTPSEQLKSLVLPALTLGIFGSALYARLTRDELGTQLQQDYARTAKAKGASKLRVLVVHALRNALVPLFTLMTLELGTLIGGAVVTESLFRWPGLGQLSVTALLERDGPVIVGTVLFGSLAVVLSTLFLDFVYVFLDPRLRRNDMPAQR